MLNLFGSPAGRALNTTNKSQTIDQSYINSLNNLTTTGTTTTATTTSTSLLSSSSSSSLTNERKINIENDLIAENYLNYNGLNSSNNNNKTKRCSMLKTNLFTKKVKFWKILENEKNTRNSLDDISNASSSNSHNRYKVCVL